MKKIILLILFFMLLLGQNVFAQNNFNVLFGGGYIFSSIDKDKLPYWENDFLFNFAMEYRIYDKLLFYVSSSYQKYIFDENRITLAVPQEIGYRFSINGENSRIYEISLGSKIFANNSRFRPYVGIGIGELFLKQGRVEKTEWMEGEQNKSTYLYSNTGRNYNLAQFNLGIGLEMNLINNFQLVLDGKMVNSFNGFSYFPITGSIKIGL